jgi:hypothetical protein
MTDRTSDSHALDGFEIAPDMRAWYEVLSHPQAWGEQFLRNRDGSPRRYRDYQALDLLCPDTRIVHQDGRDVGKTVNLSTLLLWFTFVNKGKSVLVAAPYQGQLDSIMEEVEFQLGQSDLLRDTIARSASRRLKIKRKPYLEITFTNGCVVYFRPSGPHGEVFRGLHVDLLLVDEAAWLPEEAWKALRQCLNSGGTFRVYSTPSGFRDRTYYRLTMDPDWRQFRWPSWLSPAWTAKREKELTDFYGGRETPGYQHEVAGEHGAPTYGAFDARKVGEATKDLPDYRRIDLWAEAFDGCRGDHAVRDRLQDLLNLSGGHGVYWLGADLGYTSDPSEVLLFEEDKQGIVSLLLRVHATHVPYPVIAEVIAVIDRVYQPRGLGLDQGGNGRAVEQDLLSLSKFQSNQFLGRLVGYNFGGTIGVTGKDHWAPQKRHIKEEMTRLINNALNDGKLRLPASDPEVENQLCTQTYVFGEKRIV